ncbi:hypothetical protein BDP27DRAFT_1315142 [Rhodocollybia butyracea]|uniref:Uncharacterized protein n=1 Tax=Rhodocollybia butyracea TaxID=206335 RepID=A0A9P5UCU1_9AGAR|nr:hypothetical protein BDP27DRAFT_1315142 [Rhodocollybia butyracea]
MAGANYMGGRRNATKARVKDSTGRAQKRYFGAQRLNLAANRQKLEQSSELEPSDEHFRKPVPAKSMTDIKFAHAKQNSASTGDLNNGYMPASTRISYCTPSKSRPSKLPGDAVSTSGGKRPSKVLQALDTSEPLALRAAMDNILLMPDLAGLSRIHKNRGVKRRRSSSSPCAREEISKRYIKEMPLSPDLRPPCGNIESGDMDFPHHQPALELGIAQAQFAFDVPGNGESSGLDGFNIEGYSSDNSQPSAWTNISSSTSSHSRTKRRGSPLDQEGHIPIPSTSTPQVGPSNLFDYEDPWKAIGVMLGIEGTPQTPLKMRNIRQVLAEIPTPVLFRTPAQDEDILCLEYDGGNSPRPASTLIDGTNAERNRELNPFQIFSPLGQSQQFLPNVLHSLLPYASDTSSKPPTSPSRMPRTHAHDHGSSDPRGEEGKDSASMRTDILHLGNHHERSSPLFGSSPDSLFISDDRQKYTHASSAASGIFFDGHASTAYGSSLDQENLYFTADDEISQDDDSSLIPMQFASPFGGSNTSEYDPNFIPLEDEGIHPCFGSATGPSYVAPEIDIDSIRPVGPLRRSITRSPAPVTEPPRTLPVFVTNAHVPSHSASNIYIQLPLTPSKLIGASSSTSPSHTKSLISAPTSSPGASRARNPRTKISTQLDPSLWLHNNLASPALPRYRSPTSSNTDSCRPVSRASVPFKRIMPPPIPRFSNLSPARISILPQDILTRQTVLPLPFTDACSDDAPITQLLHAPRIHRLVGMDHSSPREREIAHPSSTRSTAEYPEHTEVQQLSKAKTVQASPICSKEIRNLNNTENELNIGLAEVPDRVAAARSGPGTLNSRAAICLNLD